jgi:hypothetical protein
MPRRIVVTARHLERRYISLRLFRLAWRFLPTMKPVSLHIIPAETSAIASGGGATYAPA